MRALVTGATGFIGSHVTRALLRRGYDVRVLVRQGCDERNIAALDVERAWGDLCDRPSLDRALAGCEVLLHVGAAYTFWTPDPSRVYSVNVEGTRHVLEAARAAGVQRIVYTSTESTIGVPDRAGVGCEEWVAAAACLAGAYKRSQLLAEGLALAMGRDGLPLVVVNPTTPVGERDIKPTPTGQIIVDYLRRRMPAYVDTGLNVVDVEDVAEGHVIALEKGRSGERYILGHRNLTLQELFGLLAGITGVPAPRRRMPLWLALAAGHASQFVADRLTHTAPRVPLAAVQAARHRRFMDCRKAVQELGLPQSPVEEALRKAVRWFRDQGYAP